MKVKDKTSPCPFCGAGKDSVAIQQWEYDTGRIAQYVLCFACQARGPEAHTDKTAWMLWNSR